MFRRLRYRAAVGALSAGLLAVSSAGVALGAPNAEATCVGLASSFFAGDQIRDDVAHAIKTGFGIPQAPKSADSPASSSATSRRVSSTARGSATDARRRTVSSWRSAPRASHGRFGPLRAAPTFRSSAQRRGRPQGGRRIARTHGPRPRDRPWPDARGSTSGGPRRRRVRDARGAFGDRRALRARSRGRGPVHDPPLRRVRHGRPRRRPLALDRPAGAIGRPWRRWGLVLRPGRSLNRGTTGGDGLERRLDNRTRGSRARSRSAGTRPSTLIDADRRPGSG